MPTKRTDQLIGSKLGVEDVFRVAELAELAEDWATPGATFEQENLNEYRSLCNYYDVDGAELLFATQQRLIKGFPTEQTSVFVQVDPLQVLGEKS